MERVPFTFNVSLQSNEYIFRFIIFNLNYEINLFQMKNIFIYFLF
jgi:hypothetical protein